MAGPPVLHQADNTPMERQRRGRLPLALGLSAALLGLAAAGGSIYALLEHGVLPGAAIRDSGTSSAPPPYYVTIGSSDDIQVIATTRRAASSGQPVQHPQPGLAW